MAVNDLTIQATPTQALTHKLAMRSSSPMTVRYTGRTTNTTKTELFVDGIANARLQLPKGSTGYFEKKVMCYNVTDTAVGTGTPEVSTGTFSRLGNTTACTEGATHTACDIEADDTNDWITCSVTGADATDTLEWEVNLKIWILTYIDETATMTGIYDGINK